MFIFNPLRALRLGALLALASCPDVRAAEIVYQPINPSFGGAASNSVWLNQNADIANSFRRKKDRLEKLTADKYDPFKRDPIVDFSASLQSRLLGEMSDKIVSAIYGTNKQNSGTFTAGNATVSFMRANGTVILTISDGVRTTQIALPE